ncbi:DNRLRE domain-containing protein [Dyadobacter sp. NIV53]|uniref:CBM96 family carbohydrate-binding protein n=1 Tax=Dyadobacter sp. NIV53 TaxID=2861765 RepID=UPI001C880F04|nr:DNRLRE domain-containing protein [Dyadobacter sp. NIV53]
MKRYLLLFACWPVMFLVLTAHAQQIRLVKDINDTPSRRGHDIQERVAVNGLLFFFSDNFHGYQLWRTDGTQQGTIRLTELDAEEEWPKDLTSANGYAFFKALYKGGAWLFRSDGTRKGTIPLHRLSHFYSTRDLLEFNGMLYFSGSQNYNESLQLWKTDGTEAGTTKVKDLSPGAFEVRADYFTKMDGKLYFTINSGPNNRSVLWSSDGTEKGTTPGPLVPGLISPAAAGGYLYFTTEFDLMKTDGKSVDTVRSGLERLGEPVAAGGTIYFSALATTRNTVLWKSDGTPEGTVVVKDASPDSNQPVSPQLLTSFQDTLFFFAINDAREYELWKSDGTAGGTVEISDINLENYQSDYWTMFVAGNQLVFEGSDGIRKLWKSDGTRQGTHALTDFPILFPTLVGQDVFFAGYPESGYQLFKTSLTTEQTQPITAVTTQNSIPRHFTELNGTGYFSAVIPQAGEGLWKTDGTAAGTVLVREISGGLDLLMHTNRLVFFKSRWQLWASDGTDNGTVLVKDFDIPDKYYHSIGGFTSIGNTLYFGITSNTGTELWKSDGTPKGTVLVKTLENTDFFHSIEFKGALYFIAWNGVDRHVLWKSDGTKAGTVPAGDLSLGSLHYSKMTVSGENLFYLAWQNGTNNLAKTDGTPQGTYMVKSLPLWASGLHSAGTYVYMIISNYDTGETFLWRTDGTAMGTIELAAIGTVGEDDNRRRPFKFTNVNGKLFFSLRDVVNGDQVWVSDGTVSGTKRVTPMVQAPLRFRIRSSAGLGNLFYFNYYEPATGNELWRSDGTPEGTFMVEDLTPNENTGIEEMASINNTLLISASTSVYGYELYKYDPVPIGVQEMRINAGGTSFAASGGRHFSADQYFSGTTRISNSSGGDIHATTDDQLYREQRFGRAFNYSIPVTNGQMKLVLHFAEIYWGVPGKGGPAGNGKRRFHVDLEGIRKLTNYDIFTKAGGAMRARTETFVVDVTDGTLDIDFLKGAADMPIIAAIEVVPMQTILGPVADAYIRNVPHDAANYGTAPTLEVKAGSLPSYQRCTYLKFSLANVSQVSSAKLRLYGSNSQSTATVGLSAYGVTNDLWTETDITWNNAPASSGNTLGSVNVNNTAKYYEIDVTSFVQSQLATDQTVSFLITNPAGQNAQLTFSSREGEVHPPQLVLQDLPLPAARMTTEQESAILLPGPEASSIYPNPVTDKHISIKISNRHKGDVCLRLLNKTGQAVQTRKKTNSSASVVDMDVSGSQVSKGLFLLEITSGTHKEVLKMLVLE